MAGVTDWPFRLLCAEMGCCMAYSEMVSAKALARLNKNTISLLERQESESSLGVQIFGSDPQVMAEASSMLSGMGFSEISINMGCPAKKIVSNGEGSALLKDPKLAGRIASMCAKAATIPVTVKIRAGFSEVNAVEIARVLEESGASAIALHARTTLQGYSGKADWTLIEKVKRSIKIPLIGNGDIFEPEDALRMMEETGCNGVMIGRGAQGNPWIFKRVKSLVEKGLALPGPNIEERISVAVRHCEMMHELKGANGIIEMRKHLAWYTKGLKNASSVRARIMKAKSLHDIEKMLACLAE
jgi:nifR3 family TIM-barrel protein